MVRRGSAVSRRCFASLGKAWGSDLARGPSSARARRAPRDEGGCCGRPRTIRR